MSGPASTGALHIVKLVGVPEADVVARGPRGSVEDAGSGALHVRYDGGLWVCGVRVRSPLELRQEWWERAAAEDQLARLCWDAAVRHRHEARSGAYEACVELMDGSWTAGPQQPGLARVVERIEALGQDLRSRLESAATEYRRGDPPRAYEASGVTVTELCAAQLAAAAVYEWIVP